MSKTVALVFLAGSLALLPSRAAPPQPATQTSGRPPNDFAEMDLDELMKVKVPVVYGASKHEQRITEAPSAVSVVSRDDIKLFGYRTLADVLRGVRGVYVTSDRGYSFIGIRGVNRPGDYGGRVLVTIDGHRVNEPIYDSAFNGTEFPLDLDLVERVEVIRGPGSSLYGNNAFFGIVNVITRKGRDLQGLEAAAVAGDLGAYGVRGSFGRRFTNELEVLVSGSWYESQGHETLSFNDPFTGLPAPGGYDDYTRERKVFAAVGYHDLVLKAVYGTRDKTLVPGAYFSLVDPQSTVRDDRGFVELKYERALAEQWRLLSRVFYDYYYYKGSYFYDYSTDPAVPLIVENIDRPSVSSVGGEVQASRRVFDKHRLTFGVEGRQDLDLHQFNYDASPRFVYIDKTTDPGNLGIFGQAEIAVFTNLLVNAGLRYDYYSTFGSSWNPRAGLIYQAASDSTFKLLYGHAFRSPNAFETDYEADIYKRNSELNPERIRSYEAIWEQGIARNVRVTAALFYNQIEDLITQVVDPADSRIVFRNTDSVDVFGTEFEVEAVWEYGFRTRASYTYARATDNATDRRLSNSPEHLGKVQLVLPIAPDRVFLAFELQAMSPRTTVSGGAVNGHVLANLTLFSQNILKNLELSATVYNLWDTEYEDPVGPDFADNSMPQDRRSFRVKLTYKF